jgi:membrane-associated phospholipid phosphatase
VIPTQAEPRRPLVAARRLGITVSLVSFGLLAVLALRLHDTRDPTGFDSAVATWLSGHTGTLVARELLWLTEPVLTIGVVVVVTVAAALARRLDLAAVGAIGPVLALELESEVLKPWINRVFGVAETLTHGLIQAGYAFPSGHETGLTSAGTLLGIMLLRTRASRAVKAGGVALLAVWTVLGAAGLVRNDYHYATDTVGGVLLGLGVVLLTAVVVDVVIDLVAARAAGRVSSPGAHARTRTPHGA